MELLDMKLCKLGHRFGTEVAINTTLGVGLGNHWTLIQEFPGLPSLRSGCFKTASRLGESWKTDLWYSCSLTIDFLNKNIESLA